jgi:hypothetical protein
MDRSVASFNPKPLATARSLSNAVACGFGFNRDTIAALF